MLNIAMSAFYSVVLARNCATDNNGETTRRGLGETDREWVLLVCCENTVFGAIDDTTVSGGLGGACTFTSCTVTNGGAPVPWADEAVSSYSSQCGGKVAVLELLSDGVDILRL